MATIKLILTVIIRSIVNGKHSRVAACRGGRGGGTTALSTDLSSPGAGRAGAAVLFLNYISASERNKSSCVTHFAGSDLYWHYSVRPHSC